MKTILIYIVVFLSVNSLYAQHFDNAGFEGEPIDATVPAGWFPCAPGTTPDILPGPWGVTLAPSQGKTYVGLITRGDGSYESITQKTPLKIKKNQCYQFKLDLARSINYAGSNEIISLNVYAAESKCSEKTKVFSLKEVSHNYWKTYLVKFTLDTDAEYIILEAYFPDKENMVSGNILIDNLSIFEFCPQT